MSFVKFPKVTHLAQARKEGLLFDVPYTVTEKLDGANAGVVRTEDGLLLHSRNLRLGLLLETGGGGALANPFNGFVDYINVRREQFMALPVGTHVFGEWLSPHTLTYPTEMYRRFYVFDDGFADALDLPRAPEIGVLTAPVFVLLDTARELLDTYAATLGRPVEGIVLAPLTGDPYRPRFKLVLPAFQEKNMTSWSPKAAAKASGDTELLLTSSYPVRAYQKVCEKLSDLKGRPLSTKDTGAVLNQTWQDFLEEFFGSSVAELKYPVVDTKRLRGTFYDRTRELFLCEQTLGTLPEWAKHQLARAEAIPPAPAS